ncbi:General amino acid permease [Wickerhamomyces ciferrii]|uniref:General amino acid permease n=1 Tax=Wickerhamomyces ciferrii (strain ATCC 14091 / BCRC 22168 / CBS 111 / JCM 3599 / NBRC 0793 / NRRL Y-1031 F-60-10) TaxID=1206466 RepID=K0KJE0_WICCF|nr:General amino acid permease [Wickerhamomyces ciferrii]CCH43091.1 General amino acid permease [Wickerhamomyces ciferrii]
MDRRASFNEVPLPNLFPKIDRFPKYNAKEDEDIELVDIDNGDEVDSITSDEIRHKIEEFQAEQWDNKTNEKFFFTKMFHGGEVIEDNEGFSDFDVYNRMVQKEAILEAKTKKVLNDMQNNSLKVTKNISDQYDAGDETRAVKNKHRFKAYEQRLRYNGGHSDERPYFYRQESMGSNRTEVVDLSKMDLSQSFFNNNGGGDGTNGNENSGHHGNYNGKYHLQRKLKKQQIQMVALGGTLGVGLFLGSGKAFSIGGPLGCFLGFFISGSIVLATMLSFAEMSTLIPTTSSISGLASRFVEDAFGFALGWCYWLSFTIAMPGEVCAATIMLSYYQQLDIPSASTAGFVSLFLFAILFVNLFDVRVYGNIEYCVSLFKVLFTVALMISMVVVNVKEHYGFTYWNSAASTEVASYGPFRPTFDLNDIGSGSKNGIGGALGRLLGVVSSTLISSYAYTGSEIGFVASMECRNPRKALPSVTKRVFGRITILYLLSIFLVGLNFYSGDPRLLRYYTPDTQRNPLPLRFIEKLNVQCTPVSMIGQNSNGNQSPWIIALQSTGLCTYSSVVNSIFVVFAVSAGSSHLYVSSRTLYSMATQGKALPIFTRCTKAGVPYISVLFSGAFGLLAYLSVNHRALEAFQDFANISSATAMLMWSGMCLSFLRFYNGLKLRPDIISRNDPSYPYRSPFQPFLAIYGLVGSMLIVILMGFVVFLKDSWDTKTFFTSYGALMLFVICFAGYKIFGSSRIHRLDQLDLDSGRREMDRIIWDEDKNYSSSFTEIFKKCIGWLA